MEILDISVIACRARGEIRQANLGFPPRHLWKTPEAWNPFSTVMNHRKHAGSIYREATGGFEKKGKPHGQSDWFE